MRAEEKVGRGKHKRESYVLRDEERTKGTKSKNMPIPIPFSIPGMQYEKKG